MPGLERPVLLSVDAYLELEERTEWRCDYVAGRAYERAESSVEHNIIAGNITASLHDHLRRKPCRLFALAVKLRVSVFGEEDFYYPDVMVTCDPRDTDRFFKRFPKVLVEVLSETTERTDRREKFLSYTQIETLEEYVLVAQDKREVTVYRRANRWQPEVLNKLDQRLQLASLDFVMPLSGVYEGVKV